MSDTSITEYGISGIWYKWGAIRLLVAFLKDKQYGTLSPSQHLNVSNQQQSLHPTTATVDLHSAEYLQNY